MAIQLGSAYGKVNIDSSGVRNGVNDANRSLGSMENAAKKLGATLQSVGKAMTMSVTLPILAIGAASVKAASDLEETRNKVKVVFGDMSEDVLAWGEDAALAFGMSKQQAMEAAGTFGNLFTSMGLGRDASADMSKGLVEMAADLASFNNIDPGLVLEKLRSGLVGEVEPLRTLGINLTMAATKAKALQMGLVDANGEVTQAGLLQARYALILEQSTNAAGDFARTSSGLANQTRILNAQWKDALTTLGVNLLPIALKAIQYLNGMLEKFNNLSPSVQKAIVVILALVAVVGPLLFVLGAIVPMMGRVTGSINPFNSGIFGLIGTFIKWIAIAATVVRVLGFLGISTGAAGTFITGLATAIAGAGASMAAVLLPIIALIGGIALLYLAFKTNFMGINDILKQLWFIIKYYFGQIVKYVSDVFTKIDWSKLGKYMLMGLAQGMLGGIPMIIAAAIKAGQMALAAIKKALGISSPSKEFMKLGVFSGEGYAAGLRNAMDPNLIARTMAKPVQNMSSSQSSSNVFNLSGGLTIRDVDRLMDEKINRFAGRLNKAMGGV